MTLVLTVSCDGEWQGMPCRGALSEHREVPMLEALQEKATRAGWALGVDADLCPAHARVRDGE